MAGPWFTADYHMKHARIIEMSERPFKDLDHMETEIIQRHNSVVRPQDTVYNLGDISLNNDVEYLAKLRTRLNGNLHVIPGNHDKEERLRTAGWTILPQGYYLRHEGKRLILGHYPQRSWRNSIHGSWHLHAHCHGGMPTWGLSIDVGVDCWDYYPVNFATISKCMEALEGEKNGRLEESDQHGKRRAQQRGADRGGRELVDAGGIVRTTPAQDAVTVDPLATSFDDDDTDPCEQYARR